MNGAQVASGSVFALPSVPAAWIAVSGRHQLYVYFVANDETRLSLTAMFSRASACALSESERPCSSATCLAAELSNSVGEVAAYHRATSARSCGRSVAVALMLPTLFTSR